MAIYNGTTQTEVPIYGASHLGMFYRNEGTPPLGEPEGDYVYQLTDHLGNIRAVIAKDANNAMAVTSATDYYPFGMPMPNRQMVGGELYRYAYQGQEKDPETVKEAFQLRLWDSRIGRWLTTDPKHDGVSPYWGMNNNPINTIDPDGGSGDDHWEIDEKGKANLIDTEGVGVWIRNKGEENYKLISQYDFSSNFGALYTITNYYGANFSLFNSENFSTKVKNFKSIDHYKLKEGRSRPPFAYVKGQYNEGLSILGWEIIKPSYSSSGVNIVLINGRIGTHANNKWNFENSLGHEYFHILDNIRVNSLLIHGVNFNNIDISTPEGNAVRFQRSISSWDNVTDGFIKFTHQYEIENN